eukprot:TRINITY_DN27898_c0_g1_i1.p2 TRINITY_DN27898_c0_g1~~TRINITY_DN27898_c0_g1_i1.p2  ORF type:complete len:121 (-),score=37.06 TRINITY_DN27898_c0_g1_i1:80-442(-)
MSTVQLDEDDLDEEDMAIVREVSKKGYYHGRPPSDNSTSPQKIEALPTPVSSAPAKRSDFDDFQKKWDKFDSEEYLEGLEDVSEPRQTGMSSKTQASSCKETFGPLSWLMQLFCSRRARK